MIFLTPSQDLLSNSPYCLPYNSFDLNSENLVLDQLIFPLLFFLYSHRLVTHGSCKFIYCYRGTFTFPPLFVFFQQRSQGSAAEIVRAAAKNKKNMAAKEEKLE